MGKISQLLHKALFFYWASRVWQSKSSNHRVFPFCVSHIFINMFESFFLSPRTEKKPLPGKLKLVKFILMRRAKGTKQLKRRSKPDEHISLNAIHDWLAFYCLQDSEELLGLHLYDEFRRGFRLGFPSIWSSPSRCIYVFCSTSLHCSHFSAHAGAPCSPYSLEIFFIHKLQLTN